MNNDIDAYNQAQSETLQEVCRVLTKQITTGLPDASAKLYHANPVWFIDDNPIVGYDVAPDHVNILFWSGQSFSEAGLKAIGKFKAAGTSYADIASVDVAQLQIWLGEAKTIQWNYRDLRAHNGELIKLS